MDDIKLFDPNDKPFGQLSNNSYHPITIDGKSYPTVTNYILSNMMTTPMWKTILQNTQISGARGVNSEMINAIDFFIKPTKKEPLLIAAKKDTDLEKRGKKLIVLHKLTNIPTEDLRPWKNSQISQAIIAINKSKRVFTNRKATKYLNKAVKKYKINRNPADFLKYINDKIPKTPPPTEEELERQIQDAWVAYAETGALKEQADKEKERQKYMNYIISQVKQPFNSINLQQLKDQILREAAINQMGIYKVYYRAVNDELFSTLISAVDKGYKARFSNPDLEKILLGTGNFPIQYESNDRFLGIGLDGKGENLVGKILMQIRHNLRNKSKIEAARKKELAENQRIYDAYLAYSALRSELYNNNNQLVDYLRLNPSQIIAKYGMRNLIKGVPTQETVIQLYKYDRLNPIVMKELFQPGTMVINIRKNELQSLRDRLLRLKEDIIFNSYLEYIVKRNYEDAIRKEVDRLLEIQDNLRKQSIAVRKSREELINDVVENAIALEKSKISPSQLYDVKSRVIDLFKLGMLSASLSDKIDADIEQLNIPTEEDVREAELAELPGATPVAPGIPHASSKDEETESDGSSRSSERDPTAKRLKKLFKHDKSTRKTELVDKIISLKGSGYRSDFNDWSVNDLRQRLEALQTVELEDVDHTGEGFSPPSGNPIVIFTDPEKNHPQLRSFDPDFFTGMITIDSKKYPTIKHYIITRLIATTGSRRLVDAYGNVSAEKGIGMNAAHKSIMVDPNLHGNQPQDYLNIQMAGKVYDDMSNQTNEQLLSLFTVSALNKKFDDRSLQNLLLSTDSATILWTGPNQFLGAGQPDRPGFNYVGKTMMTIREKIKENREDEEDIEISEEDIMRFINKDKFIMDWIKMRVKDMCDVVYKAQQYMKIKENFDFDMNEEVDFIRLINTVLDVIYQPCAALVVMSKDVDIPVPDFMVRMVEKCSGMSTGEAPTYVTDMRGVTSYNKEIQDHISRTQRIINEIKSEFWGSTRIEHSVTESREFEQRQRDEWHNFWREMNQSDAPKSAKDEELAQFREQQKQEYNEFWGIETGIKSKDDISRHEHRISEIQKDLSRYLQNAKERDKHFYLITKNIAKIYWDRIVVMINTLIKNVQPSTAENIRDTLVKVEMLTSEPANCLQVISNEEDNCIVSALLNLLKGIDKFKSQLGESTGLDEDDVKFAGSIILNSKFNPQNTWVDKEPEELEDDESERDPPAFVIDASGFFPGDDSPVQEVGYGSDLDSPGENPHFYFKWGAKRNGKSKPVAINGDLEKVEQQVVIISPKNSRKVSEEVLKMVETIKRSNLSSKIKQNRINFFATVR